MHKSNLGCVIIDCPTNDVTEAAHFWGKTLGGSVSIDDDKRYAQIHEQGELKVLVQAVEHPARVHLDIPTDDKDAEVARLRDLGAEIVNLTERWVVMEAPTGHRFCIVGPQNDTFEQKANVWDAD